MLTQPALLIAFIISLFTITGCSHSTLTTMPLSPEFNDDNRATTLSSQQQWQISSVNHRVELYLIEVSSGTGVAQLVNEQQNSRHIVEQALKQQWQKMALPITQSSDYHIQIRLEKLLAKIDQQSTKHSVDSTIIITVVLSHENESYTRTFTSKSTYEGGFSADLNKIAKYLNYQLSQLLNDITHDQQLNAKLQHF